MSKIEITDELLYKFVPKAEEFLLEQLPPDEKLNHTFSNGFNRKMKRLIRKNKYHKLKNTFATSIKRVAIIILIIFTISLTTIMSVQALRVKFLEIITKIYKEFTSISFIIDDEKSDIQINVIEPSYIPEGFEKVTAEILFTSAQFIYSNDANIEIIYEQAFITNNQIIIDTEDTEIEKLQICGNQVDYVFRKGIHNFIWYKEKYAFSLISSVDKDELMKMAESILTEEEKNN